MLGIIPFVFLAGKNRFEFSLLSIGNLKWQRSFFKIVWKKKEYFLFHFFWTLNYEKRVEKRKRAKRNV